MRFTTQLAIGAFAISGVCLLAVVIGKVLHWLDRHVPPIDQEEIHG